MEDVIWEVGLEEVEAYVLSRHNMAAQYITTQTILGLCEESVQRTVMWVSKRWWEQEGLDLEGARAAAEAVIEGYRRRRKERRGVAGN